MKENASKSIKGKNANCLTNQSRFDIVLLNSDYQVKFAIEAKCTRGWVPDFEKDLDRLMKLQCDLSKNHEEASMQAGIFAAVVSTESKKGLKNAEENIEKNIESWQERIENFCLKNRNIKVSFNRSPKTNVFEYDDNVNVITSLCAVIKSQ